VFVNAQLKRLPCSITLAADLATAKRRAAAWKGVETRECNRKAREIEEPAQQR
jgi:hypothetical protein